MIRRQTLVGIAAAGFSLVMIASSASAAVVLSYEAGTATPLGGGAVSVPIYLHETLTEGSASVIAPDGLFAIGVSLTRQIGDATITSFVANPTFDQSNPGTSNTGTIAKINAQQDANFGNGPNPDGSGLILFGTATIQQGLLSTQFAISDFGPGDQVIDYGFQAHDGSILSAGFTVAAVPEPTSIALLGVAGMLLVRRRVRD